MLINDVLIGTNACWVRYAAASGRIYLLNDTASSWGSGAAPGSGSALQNSACQINAANSSVAPSGDNLTLTLDVSFLPGFAGSKTIYIASFDQVGVSSNWQTGGTWTVP